MLLTSKVYPSHSSTYPLLLIHGMGSASTAWKTIAPNLEKLFTVVTIDLPGHGETPLDKSQLMDPQSLALAVIQTMKTHGYERFHVVGNSLGGWVALEMAVLKPEAIASITGLAPAGLWLAPYIARYPGTAIARMLANGLKVVSPMLLHYEWARKIGFKSVSPRWKEFSYETCLDATLAMATSAGYYPAWDAMLKKRFDGQIKSSIPITVIFGDEDRTLPTATSQEKSLVPAHTRWINVAQCGHAPMWDHPALIVEEIIKTTGIKP
ncbi:unannotated protein [freshwater metagenome]|uniref:Unannotated protein n=1 Tax=freshwater metagenome TaxID=449393 RepID=A0A6J7AL05_9ZZZZ|nr:alpha/beta hydrolase [Actinomycetota bacterium]MSX52194.1 alpha/beta fold hydrolase [Actinomycetota bacterium]